MSWKLTWAPSQIERMERAIEHYNEMAVDAQDLYGADYVQPMLPTTFEDLYASKLKPGNYNEFRKIERLYSGAKITDFTQASGKGFQVSGMDVKLAERIDRQYSSGVSDEIAQLEANIDALEKTKKNVRGLKARQHRQKLIDADRQRLNELKAYNEYSPNDANSASQFRGRLNARLSQTWQGSFSFDARMYKSNFLAALKRGNVTNSGYGVEIYNAVNSMDDDTFMDFVDAHPELDIPFVYNSGDLDSGIEALGGAVNKFLNERE